MSAKEFILQIDHEMDQKEAEIRREIRVIAMEAVKAIVLKSPVDTGYFRHNWVPSTGGFAATVKPQKPDAGPNSYPNDAVENTLAELTGYAAKVGYPAIVIQNNLPYALPLENGYSKQSPNGMVALTVAELEAKFSQVTL